MKGNNNDLNPFVVIDTRNGGRVMLRKPLEGRRIVEKVD